MSDLLKITKTEGKVTTLHIEGKLDGQTEKELLGFHRDDVIKIREAINHLAENARPHGSKKLSGSLNEYRLRVGNYRILYTINDTIITIYIFRIAHRKEAY